MDESTRELQRRAELGDDLARYHLNVLLTRAGNCPRQTWEIWAGETQYPAFLGTIDLPHPPSSLDVAELLWKQKGWRTHDPDSKILFSYTDDGKLDYIVVRAYMVRAILSLDYPNPEARTIKLWSSSWG